MSNPSRYRPVVLIRGVLLTALALFLGGVVAVFVSNRMRATNDSEPRVESGLDLNLAEAILSGKGFDFEVTDGEKRLYHIRADRILASRDNVVTLEGLVIAVERESGDVYRLAANKGSYRSEDKGAEVRGKVVLTGPDGLELRGQRFDLLRKGTLIKSRGPVEFSAGGDTSGSAEALSAYLDKDRFQLSGNIRFVRSAEAGESELTLEAERMNYDKRVGLIHAEGGVRLRNGRDQLTCDRIALTLAGRDEPGAGSTRFVRARLNVAGSFISSDPRGFDREIAFTGDEASISYGKDGNDPELAEIVGTRENPAQLDASDETGLVRRFASRRIEADLAGGEISRLRTGGPAVLSEFFAIEPERELARVCGSSAVVRFDARGDLARMEFRGGADIHRAGFHGRGDALTASGRETVELRGEPARLLTRRGELTAPKISRNESAGTVEASGGVRTLLPPEVGFTMVKATETTDDLPIQVTSERANWSSSESRFEFQGDVRAWQGESFITARRLIGENDGRVRGEGGVQTTLERSNQDDQQEETEVPSPVKVSAESFEYDKSQGLIEYRGEPEVREGGRLMSCDELAVFLGDRSKLDRLECRGDALIDDRIGANKVRGALAVYRPNEQQVVVTGNPVTLEKPDGSMIRASRVIYDFETSIARFQSATSTSAETEEGTP